MADERQNNRAWGFLTLPLEVRQMIYQRLFEDAPLLIWALKSHGSFAEDIWPFIVSCKSVYHESISMFYASCRIDVEGTREPLHFLRLCPRIAKPHLTAIRGLWINDTQDLPELLTRLPALRYLECNTTRPQSLPWHRWALTGPEFEKFLQAQKLTIPILAELENLRKRHPKLHLVVRAPEKGSYQAYSARRKGNEFGIVVTIETATFDFTLRRYHLFVVDAAHKPTPYAAGPFEKVPYPDSTKQSSQNHSAV